MKRKLAVIAIAAVFALCLGLVGCGGSSSNSTPESDASKDIQGEWNCIDAVSISDGTVYEISDVLNGNVMTMFIEEDTCYVYVDTNHTTLDWSLDGNKLTLSGDATYSLTVADDGKKIIWDNFEDTGYNLEFVKAES